MLEMSNTIPLAPVTGMANVARACSVLPNSAHGFSMR